jgi:hypothetical protein
VDALISLVGPAPVVRVSVAISRWIPSPSRDELRVDLNFQMIPKLPAASSSTENSADMILDSGAIWLVRAAAAARALDALLASTTKGAAQPVRMMGARRRAEIRRMDLLCK